MFTHKGFSVLAILFCLAAIGMCLAVVGMIWAQAAALVTGFLSVF